MNNRAMRLAFGLLVFALVFTGFAQMPIFARYYLADVPGFAWTADYHLNHILHYVLAIVLLLILGWRLPMVLKRGLGGPWGVAAGLCWAGIVLTGMIRVMKNEPNAFFPPDLVMWVDWTHLGFVLALSLVALARPRRRGMVRA